MNSVHHWHYLQAACVCVCVIAFNSCVRIYVCLRERERTSEINNLLAACVCLCDECVMISLNREPQHWGVFSAAKNPKAIYGLTYSGTF